MFTTVDKALAALVMGLLSILNLLFGIDLGLSPETVSAIIAALTPLRAVNCCASAWRSFNAIKRTISVRLICRWGRT